ncbi:MAG TPA: hypothetical protein VLA93_00090 [Pyrinomonadaceae bacterium]|nr:hypothetical protein [Pyrinomonadaceae bacterium]
MKTRITFLMTGLIAGVVCVAPGVSWLMLLTLTWGVGPAFFVAVVVGIIITGARHHLHVSFFRYGAGLVACFVTYLLALMVFFGVYGFTPDWFGFRASDNVDQFGMDVILGLVTAATFAAGGITLFSFVLTGRWSNFLLLRLLSAGIVTIIVTFIVNFPFHSYWSFYGVLVPLGTALFCGTVGAHIWEHFESERQTTATACEPHQPQA